MPRPYQVVTHSPGVEWLNGVRFQDQPNVALHMATMRSWLDAGLLVVGGPFLDERGGGTIITRFDSLENAVAAAEADPAVQSGLLTVDVRPWFMAMWDDIDSE